MRVATFDQNREMGVFARVPDAVELSGDGLRRRQGVRPAGSSGEGRDSEPAGIDLISRMLVLEPENRITPSEALEHEFFKY